MQRDLLEKAGFNVIITTNGREAWDCLTTFRRKVEEEGRPLAGIRSGCYFRYRNALDGRSEPYKQNQE